MASGTAVTAVVWALDLCLVKTHPRFRMRGSGGRRVVAARVPVSRNGPSIGESPSGPGDESKIRRSPLRGPETRLPERVTVGGARPPGARSGDGAHRPQGTGRPCSGKPRSRASGVRHVFEERPTTDSQRPCGGRARESSRLTVGRPRRPRREIRVQWLLNACRCQRTTVAGWTSTRAPCQPFQNLRTSAQNRRSVCRSRGRRNCRKVKRVKQIGFLTRHKSQTARLMISGGN